MIALIQRVSDARVLIDSKVVNEIGCGILALVGIERGDDEKKAEKLFSTIVNYRIFEDDSGKMNRNLTDISGDLLLVPQFTLAADTSKGRRPSFDSAAPPDTAKVFFDGLVSFAGNHYDGRVATGQFGANMQVSLTNDGPITFWLQI